MYFEEGRFSPGGFVHLGCAADYFETNEVREPILQFSRALGDAEREELIRALT